MPSHRRARAGRTRASAGARHLATAFVATPWLARGLAVAGALALMWLLATPHPPALAIALIPQLLDAPDRLSFTAAIGAGSAAMYLAVLAADRFALRASKPVPVGR